MNFERPSNFRTPRLMTFPQAIQFCKLKWEAMEKANFELRENVSNMEAKLQESLMKNVLLEEKIHEINSKHDDLEQYTRKYNLEIDGIPGVWRGS